jgi:hypothetical protein
LGCLHVSDWLARSNRHLPAFSFPSLCAFAPLRETICLPRAALRGAGGEAPAVGDGCSSFGASRACHALGTSPTNHARAPLCCHAGAANAVHGWQDGLFACHCTEGAFRQNQLRRPRSTARSRAAVPK